MIAPLPSWVRDAATLPLAFAQVREDPNLDLDVVQRVGGGARVLMVASGGCTAAFLASSSLVAHIHLVDLNPAQLALTRLKLRLLNSADATTRLRVMGHVSMSVPERREQLATTLQELDLHADVLGPLDMVAQDGPDHAGRYERVFAQLRTSLRPVESDLFTLLMLRAPVEQSARVRPTCPLGTAIDRGLEEVMALPNLVSLFGEGATRNRVEPFSHHFARRTRWALASLPAADNPYLWQMYRGRYPDGNAAPWLTAAAPNHQLEVSWSCVLMAAALKEGRGDFDFVHLSNILDWLTPEEAQTTLELAASALRRGGWVLVRQLNSTLDIPSLGPGFSWHGADAETLHARDRSFFYRHLHLGRKR
jgi:S-adenosylmethionine-diacylglycerol 3-amino-3-carboxypropyl transferase